jgi:hypothetical protein
MMEDDKLYGFDGDEYLQSDPVTVYENWANDWDFPSCLTDPDGFAPEPFTLGQLVIEEWSTRPVGDGLVSADRILEWIYDGFCDDAVFDEAGEACERAASDPEVVAAFEAARSLMASKITGWKMADRKLRDLIVTWDENNEPLLDGEPMYRKTS